MALSESQRVTLAAHICSSSDPAVQAALAVRNDTELTRLYNLPSSFIVWRESIAPEEYREGMVWTEIDQLTVGKARIWEWVTQQMTMPIDATKENVRAGLAEVFPANSETRPALLNIAKEAATLAESLFATGTGTTALPGVRTFVGTITTEDVGRALNDNPCA